MMRLSLAAELSDGAAMNRACGDAAGNEEVSVKRQETLSLKRYDFDDGFLVRMSFPCHGGCNVQVILYRMLMLNANFDS